MKPIVFLDPEDGVPIWENLKKNVIGLPFHTDDSETIILQEYLI